MDGTHLLSISVISDMRFLYRVQKLLKDNIYPSNNMFKVGRITKSCTSKLGPWVEFTPRSEYLENCGKLNLSLFVPLHPSSSEVTVFQRAF